MKRSITRVPSILGRNPTTRQRLSRQCAKTCQLLATPMSTIVSRSLFIPKKSLLLQSRSWYSTVDTPAPVFLGDCPGCGAPFQKSDPSLPGYLPDTNPSPEKPQRKSKSLSNEEYNAMLETLDPETRALLGEEEIPEPLEEQVEEPTITHDRVVCQRCHTLEHQHKVTTESTPEFLRASQQFGSLEFLKTKTDPLIVVVFDITDLPASLGNLPQLLNKNPGARLLLAANKIDILPKSARRHEQRLRDWIVSHMKSLGISTQQIVSTSLISAKKGWGVQSLMRKIDRERRPTDDIYLVGCTNVGKSALVNQFMSQIRGSLDPQGRQLKAQLRDQFKITSSAIPGTTMGTIKIPLHALGMSDFNGENWQKRKLLTKDHYLIDTPGIINDQQLIHKLPFQEQKKLVMHQKEMNPVTFLLEPGKSMLLKPLVRIDLLRSSKPVLMTLFSPLPPHLTKTEKLPAAQALEAQHRRPVKDAAIIGDLEPMDEVVRVKGVHRTIASVDFAFSGVGWVSLTGEFDAAQFRIWVPKGCDPYKVFNVRDPPLLPFEYKGSVRKFFGSGDRTRQ